MDINVYHKDGKIFIEMSVHSAYEFRHELSDLVGEGNEYSDELYQKLYYQTLN